MSTILEARAIITAETHGLSAAEKNLAALERKITGLSKASGTVGKVSRSIGSVADQLASRKLIDGLSNFENRLASGRMIGRLTEFSAQAERAANRVSHLSRVMTYAGRVAERVGPIIGPAAAGAVGFGALHATKSAIAGGAHIQSERARLGVAGVLATEIAAADMQSAVLAAQFTNVRRSAILEAYKETRSVLLHPEETPRMLPTVIAAKSAMDALDSSGHLSEGLQFAVKGGEVLGLTQNEARFKSYLDSFIKAQQVMGKTITPEQQYEFAKYVKSSGISLSDRFKMTTAVSLAQEMGGSTTGQSIDQFTKQIIGGFQGNNHAAAKEFIRLGLANKDDFEETKSGEIKGMKGGRKVKGADLARTDPDKWVADYLVPALEKQGYKSLDDQVSEVRRLFPAGRAADLVSKLISQRESFANHARLYDAAAGISGGQSLIHEDPTAALGALTTSLENFGATLTSPVMKKAAETMSSWASTMGSYGEALAKWQKDNPEAAKWAAGGAIGGGLGVAGLGAYKMVSGVMGGFGLSGSAAALDGAAANLSAAAVKLGGASVAGPAGAASSAGWLAWLSRLAGPALLGASADSTPLADPTAEQRAQAKKDADAYAKSHGGYWHPLTDLANWWKTPSAPSSSGYTRDYTLGSSGFSKMGTLVPPSGLGYVSDWDLKHAAPGPMGHTMPDLSNIKATVEGPITAQVSGEANVAVTVTVSPTSELLKAIAEAKSAKMPLNTGHSMPEAAPTGRGAQ